MTELLLNGKSPRKILEIGTGCGYQTAVIDQIISEVYSIELLPHGSLPAPICAPSSRWRGCNMATAIWACRKPLPFDAIIMTAAASHAAGTLGTITRLAGA